MPYNYSLVLSISGMIVLEVLQYILWLLFPSMFSFTPATTSLSLLSSLSFFRSLSSVYSINKGHLVHPLFALHSLYILLKLNNSVCKKIKEEIDENRIKDESGNLFWHKNKKFIEMEIFSRNYRHIWN
jgi:hypothetical protein